MKKIIFLFLLLSLPSVSFGNNFTTITSLGVELEYITYEVGSEQFDIRVGISDDALSLSSIGRDLGAISGINGAFFCPADYSSCGGKNYTINERFVEGNDMSFYTDTGERAVFGWDSGTLPFLHQTSKINTDLRSNIYEGLGNFPVLYSNGVNILEHYHDIGLYDRKMSARLQRHFICSNKEKTEIFFGRSSASSLDSLAPALDAVGCWDGINLDAGASSHFNYNGKQLEVGNRQILDGFFIVPKTFDAKKIETAVMGVIPKVEKLIISYGKTQGLQQIDSINSYITNYRNVIYKENTSNITDEQGNIVGSNVDISDSKQLEKIFRFNIIERELKATKLKLRNLEF